MSYGDTIEILYQGEKKKIRLIGIDTPETVDPRKPVQCFGKEASAKTKSLLDEQYVRLEKDPIGDTIDKYGRLLWYVYRVPESSGRLNDNLFVNAELVKQGYAYAYTKYPFSRSEEFKRYETEARNARRGLWSPSTCSPTDVTEEKTSTSTLATSSEQVVQQNNMTAPRESWWRRFLRFLFS